MEADCFLGGCGNRAEKMGFCLVHFAEWRDHIALIRYGARGSESERFWAKVNKTDTCWLWTGSARKGYGSFRVGRGAQLRNIGAHRFSYEEFVGPIPDGLMLDHLCRVQLCVRPDHLEPVTNAENVRRSIAAIGAAGRGRPRRGAVCRNGHAMTPENTGSRLVRGVRYETCKACSRERGLRWKAALQNPLAMT